MDEVALPSGICQDGAKAADASKVTTMVQEGLDAKSLGCKSTIVIETYRTFVG